MPREPLWRGLNMARGAYLKDLGNTPGHVNHWSKRSFHRAARAARAGGRGDLAVPVDHAARPDVVAEGGASGGRSGYGRGASILSVGIATTGIVTFAYFSVASHVLTDAEYTSISLLWSVLFVTVSVIYRPIEQLLSRTIAERRARGHEHDHPLRTPLLIQGGFALAFAVVALALRGPIQDGLFDGSAALYWILFVAVLAYAASYFARGWLAGHQWFGLYGGLVLPRGDVAAAVRARGGGRDRGAARTPSRWAWRRRRSSRSSSSRSPSRAGRPRPGSGGRATTTSGWRAAAASPWPCC